MDLANVEDIDLNNIFNLTYTFDTLKLLLGNLAKNQKTMSKKLNDLENEIGKLNQKNSDLEKTLTNNQSLTDKKLKALEIVIANMKKKEAEKKSKSPRETKEDEKKVQKTESSQHPQSSLREITDQVIDQDKKEDQKQIPTEESKQKSIIESKHKETEQSKQGEEPRNQQERVPTVSSQQPQQGQQENIIKPSEVNASNAKEEPSAVNANEEDENEDGELFINDNIELEDLKRRVSELEKKVKSSAMPRFHTSSSNNSAEGLDLVLANVKSLNDMLNDLKENNDNLSKEVDDLKLKVSDFNIADLFKDAKVEGGGIDASKLLVMNLEKKIFAKMGIHDEKFKKDEEDIYRMKNEITKLKNINDTYKRNIDNTHEDLKKLIEDITNSNENVENQFTELENKLSDIYKKLITKIDENDNKSKRGLEDVINKLNTLNDNSGNSQKGSESNANALSSDDLKFIKQLNSRVNDLEKNLKLLANSVNIEEIKDDVRKLKEEMKKKGNEEDLFDINNKVNNHSNDISNLKEEEGKLIEDTTKCFNDINFLIKKFEVLNSAIISLKSLDDNQTKNVSSMIDTSKFLEISQFNEFLKSYQKEHEKLHREIDDLKRYLDEIADILKTRVSDEDLKNLESIIMAKIDELNIRLNKKFADKIDTTKSIKYLDTQIKHIIDVYIKNKDKGDNWLIAKKPIGGYSCASCEAYLGELKEKDEYLAWNKYPMRESQDKAYRIGNGFSRMLNLLNLDVKNSYENNGAEDEGRNHSSDKKVNPIVSGSSLPQIKRSREEHFPGMNIESTSNNVVSDGEENKEGGRPGPNDPRVLRVYKKTKVNSEAKQNGDNANN